MSLGQLWLELLRFYTLEFALEEHIISIRLKDLLSREVKNWPRRRLAIEGKRMLCRGGTSSYRSGELFEFFFLLLDPFALKRNVARSLNSQMVFEYIQERFRMAYKYFACPQRKGTGGHQSSQKADRQGAKLEEFEMESAFVNKEEDDGKDEKSQRGGRGLKEDEESESDNEDDCSDPSTKKDEKTLDASRMEMALNEGNKPSFSPNGLLDSDKEGEEEEEGTVSDTDVTSEDLHYVFDKMIFTGGKVIMIHYFHPFYTC